MVAVKLAYRAPKIAPKSCSWAFLISVIKRLFREAPEKADQEEEEKLNGHHRISSPNCKRFSAHPPLPPWIILTGFMYNTAASYLVGRGGEPESRYAESRRPDKLPLSETLNTEKQKINWNLLS